VATPDERRIIAEHWHLLHALQHGEIAINEALGRYRAARAEAGLPVSIATPDELLPEEAKYREAREARIAAERAAAAKRRDKPAVTDEVATILAALGVTATERPPDPARAAVSAGWGRELGIDDEFDESELREALP
jgi:hypothetical protein